AALVETLAGIGDDTSCLRELARFTTDRRLEVLRAGLDKARSVTDALTGVRWEILSALAERSDERANVVLERLRSVAGHDEQAASVAKGPREGGGAAIHLVGAKPQPPVTPPVVPVVVVPDVTGGGSGNKDVTVLVEISRSVPANELENVVSELRALAKKHP